MSIDPGIFKAYDVRGLYGEQIDGDVAEAVGRAFVRVLAGLAGKPASSLRVGLGRDMRLSAPELAARYRDGMVAEGAHVLDAGMVGTEMLYFLVGSRDLDGGLMCTASHNPAKYTGAKLVERGAVALSGDEGIGEMRELIDAGLGDAPGADILYDIRASRAVPDVVTAAGGTAHVNRVGHAFFKRRMRDEGGAFGGEVSGHYYFRDFYNADSGTIPALLILELLSKHDAKLSELLEPLRSRYFISGEINSEVADQQGKIDEIERRYADGRLSYVDGVSVDYDDWHFNVRPSNTEPLLRLCLESLVSEEDMERRRDEVLALIRS